MSARLGRLLDEIARTEEKIETYRERLRELNVRKKQLEDEEIVKSVRSMRLGSREMLALLEGIQNGTVSVLFPDGEKAGKTDAQDAGGGEDMAEDETIPEDFENGMAPGEPVPESGD